MFIINSTLIVHWLCKNWQEVIKILKFQFYSILFFYICIENIYESFTSLFLGFCLCDQLGTWGNWALYWEKWRVFGECSAIRGLLWDQWATSIVSQFLLCMSVGNYVRLFRDVLFGNISDHQRSPVDEPTDSAIL